MPENTPPAIKLPILKLPLEFFGIPSDPSARPTKAAVERLDDYINRMTANLVKVLQAYNNAFKAREVAEQARAAENTINMGGNPDKKTQASPVPTPPLPEEPKFDKQMMEALKVMPLPIYRVKDEDAEIPSLLFGLITEHLYYFIDAYKKTKDLSLLQCFAFSPELIYHVTKADPEGTRSMWPEDEHLFSNIQGGPLWAIKWLQDRRLSGTADAAWVKEKYEQIVKMVYNMREHDAASAHFWIYLASRKQNAEEKLEIVQKYQETLATHPQIAILTALEHPDLDCSSFLNQQLGFENPMWIYNWAKLVPPGPGRSIEHKFPFLHKNIPWLVQYILGTSPSNAENLVCELEECRKQPVNPYWAEYLELFLKDWRQKHAQHKS